MGNMKIFWRKGDPFILMTGLGLLLALAMVFFMIAVIFIKGFSSFWPHDLVQYSLNDDKFYLGEYWSEGISKSTNDSTKALEKKYQTQLKIGNREIYGFDFVWIDNSAVVKSEFPQNAITIERMEYGNFYGFIVDVFSGDSIKKESDLFDLAKIEHKKAIEIKEKIVSLESELNELISPISKIQREIELLKLENLESNSNQITEYEAQEVELQNQVNERYNELTSQIVTLKETESKYILKVKTIDDSEKEIKFSEIVNFFKPNELNWLEKTTMYFTNVAKFLIDNPRESNTEGGVFPAIFGTVLMVLIMSIAVVPLGVLAALYLNEYAKQGLIIRIIRLSVSNLAGVPSIVYGIFGLGFFIYMVGGSIDQFFFSDKLPEPTFGTGGILWASLTLSLLALPVVVVATEEGILAVPRANKEGALALGATKWQMIKKIVLPNAMPGILTGVILAISRGAGEVAPLMITGVVKLAPSMPLDFNFPFLHLDRKFMHLGFHIYDVGFQSPNVEAALPMVYTTALLLIFIVIGLNLLAILLRSKLRKKYKSSTF